MMSSLSHLREKGSSRRMPGGLSEAVGLKKNGEIGGGADIIDAGPGRNGNPARACVDERCAAYRRTSFDLCFDIDLSSSLFGFGSKV